MNNPDMMAAVAAAKAVVPEISPAEATALMENEDTLVIDVREADELAASGKVKGAVHVPRAEVPATIGEDATIATDRTILLYCGSGARSALAGKALMDMGFTGIRNLGGFQDWAASGGAVEPV